MSEAARIRPVPDAPEPAVVEAPQSITASGWPQLIEAASAAGPTLGAGAMAGYVINKVASEAGQTLRTYISETQQTERERIRAEAGSPPAGNTGQDAF